MHWQSKSSLNFEGETLKALFKSSGSHRLHPATFTRSLVCVHLHTAVGLMCQNLLVSGQLVPTQILSRQAAHSSVSST